MTPSANLDQPTGPSRHRGLSLLGRGGFSAVYLARDLELNRLVAMKVMSGRYADSAWARSRLLFEAEVTAGLDHPGVVPVYGRGEDATGRPYFTMRYVDGETFEAAARRYHAENSREARARLLNRLVEHLVDACYTADYAHTRGIVHRDLTPANILLGRHGETQVVDWGLARWIGDGRPDAPEGPLEWPSTALALTGTRAGEAVGTPRYMSPEQAWGRWESLGPATDVFGLGATLYRLLAGRPPFEADDDRESERLARRHDCPRPRELNRRVPAALETVCLKAMLPRPDDRYPTALELGDELARWAAGAPTQTSRRATLRAWNARGPSVARPARETPTSVGVDRGCGNGLGVVENSA